MSRPSGHTVLAHGFTGSSRSWGGGVVDGLTAAGLSPVPIDLPGHGTGAAVARVPTLEAALGTIGDACEWPADLVGYSMGARLALHFVVAHPGHVRRLVLESGSPGLRTESERATRRAADLALAERLRSDGIEAFVDFWDAQPMFESRTRLAPELVARQRVLRLRNDPSALAAALEGLGTGALPSIWEALPEVRTPTLLLVGELDVKYVDIAGRMAAAMPDARVVVVPEAGHTVHLERPSAWLDAVVGFLGRPTLAELP